MTESNDTLGVVELFDAVYGGSLAERVEAVLRHDMTEREAQVIRARFGIGCNRSYTLQEVGMRLGVTRERVRQIEAKALRKLRRPTQGLRMALMEEKEGGLTFSANTVYQGGYGTQCRT